MRLLLLTCFAFALSVSVYAQVGIIADVEYIKICRVDSIDEATQVKFWRIFANSGVVQDYTYDFTSTYTIQGQDKACEDIVCDYQTLDQCWQDTSGRRLYTYQYVCPTDSGLVVTERGYVDAKTGEIAYVLEDTCTVEVSYRQSTSLCDYTLTLEHPDSSGVPHIKVLDPQPDDIGIKKEGRFVVTDCLGDTSFNVVQPNTENVFLLHKTGPPLPDFSFINYIELRKDSDGTILQVPLSFVGVYLAVFSGCAGTITAGDLIYNSTNPANYANALQIAVENYMCTQGYTNGVHYSLPSVNVVVTGTDADVSFRFLAKHDPTSEWIGPDITSTNIEYRASIGVVTGNFIEFNTGGAPLSVFYNSPCGIISLATFALDPAALDNMASNWNNIVTTTNYHNYTINPTSNPTASCNEDFLIAEATGCPSLPTYLWSTGDTGDSIKWDGTPPQPTVVVDCDCAPVVTECCDSCLTQTQIIDLRPYERLYDGQKFQIPASGTATITVPAPYAKAVSISCNPTNIGDLFVELVPVEPTAGNKTIPLSLYMPSVNFSFQETHIQELLFVNGTPGNDCTVLFMNEKAN